MNQSEDLQSELRQTQQELQRSLAEQNRLRDLVNRVDEAQALALAAETAKDAAQQKVRDLSRLLAESVQKNHGLQKQLRAATTSSSEDTAELREALEKERASRTQLELKLQEKNSDLGDLELALATSEEQVYWLEGEVADREEAVVSVTRQTATYLEKLRGAQEKLLSLGQAVTERNQMIRQLQEQRVSLAAKCRTWEALHDQLKARNAETEAELSKNQEELEVSRWELQETIATLDDSSHLISSLQDQVSTQLQSARAEIFQLQAKLASSEGELNRVREQYETLTDLPALKDFPAL